jgi:transcriptional/translational regulatory protein YebC/TACO1
MAARNRRRDLRKCYINDQMTQVGGHLAKHSRDLKKQGHLKYSWTRLGKIFVKKDDLSKTFEIQIMEDFDKVL